MSVESPDQALAPAIGAGEHALAFRIALAAAAGFTLGHLLGWDFPFLPSLIAVQLLSSGASLDVKRAFGFVLLMAIGCSVSLFISLIFADKFLYVLSEDGVLALVEARPDQYREVSRFEVPSGQFPTWAPPTVADGRLYVREQDRLMCFDIGAR